MHNLVGPLWGFFQFLRHKTPIPLALDQYIYFFNALHLVDDSTLSTEEDLREFTKIFWLHDPAFENQYDYYFKTFLDWDKLLPKLQRENLTKEPATKIDANPIIDKKEEKDPAPERAKPVVPDTQPETVNAEEQVEFKLVLQETNQVIEEHNSEYIPQPHNFTLSDLAIMPFDNRNFIQRLRRKVETAELVPTDQLDIPSMVNSFVQKGFIGDIIYEMNDASHSNVVFLVDRNESMYAFEFLENHFVRGLKQLPHCTFEYYSFKGVPALTDDGAHYKLKAVQPNSKDIETNQHHWSANSLFMIFSDAGALTGIVDRERMKSTVRWWMYFQNISPNLYWINPVTFEQMNDCTAKRLQMTIPMTDPSDKALYQMIHSKKIAYR